MVWNMVIPIDMATCSCINAPSSTLAPAFTLLYNAIGSPRWNKSLTTQVTIDTNGWKMINTQTAPNRLNKAWPKAAFLASALPPSDASSGVILVPMLAPSTMAQAMSNEIQPLAAMMSTMAKVAALDWMTMVTIQPTSVKNRMDKKPIDVYCCSEANTSGDLERSGTLALMASRPMNRNTKPMSNSPMFL